MKKPIEDASEDEKKFILGNDIPRDVKVQLMNELGQIQGRLLFEDYIGAADAVGEAIRILRFQHD